MILFLVVLQDMVKTWE